MLGTHANVYVNFISHISNHIGNDMSSISTSQTDGKTLLHVLKLFKELIVISEL